MDAGWLHELPDHSDLDGIDSVSLYQRVCGLSVRRACAVRTFGSFPAFLLLSPHQRPARARVDPVES